MVRLREERRSAYCRGSSASVVLALGSQKRSLTSVLLVVIVLGDLTELTSKINCGENTAL